MKYLADNKIGCELHFYSDDLNPDVITHELNLFPDRKIIKGEQKVNSQGKIIEDVFEKENVWIYSFESKTTIHELLLNFFDILLSRKEKIDEIACKCKSSYVLCFSYSKDYNTYINLSPRLIKKINSINLEIVFDLYSL